MENIIFYGLVLLCIVLLFVIGYNYAKINRLKAGATFWENSFNDVSKRLQELIQQKTDLEEVYKAAIAERDVKIKELEESIDKRDNTFHSLYNAMQKQVDEIIILKEQVESLTNHLQEKAKPFDAMEELDNLTIYKDKLDNDLEKMGKFFKDCVKADPEGAKKINFEKKAKAAKKK